MKTQDISYQIDGKTFTGYLADGAKGRKAPGVLLVHQGGGLAEHTKERARMLAELGYVGFALDMYGEQPTSRERAMEIMNAVVRNPATLAQRVRAGLDVLLAHDTVDRPRIAAIGFCFGGAVMLELARLDMGLKCVVAFHPGMQWQPETDDRKVTCKVMLCAGDRDPLIAPQSRERFVTLMNAAKADWQLLVYGNAGHSFTDRSVDAMGMAGFAYHEPTDKRSWAAMRELFDETLGAP